MTSRTIRFRLVFKLAGGLAGLFCAACCLAQTIVPGLAVRDLGLAVSYGDSRFFYSQTGATAIAAVRQGPPPASPIDLFVLGPAQERRRLATLPGLGQVLAASAEYVLYSEPDLSQRTITWNFLRMASGESRTLKPAGSHIVAAAVSKNRLAVLSSGDPMRSQPPITITVYDCASGEELSRADLPVAASGAQLFFADPETLLMTRSGTFEVTSISLAGSRVAVERTFELSGEEVAQSLAKSTPARGGKVAFVLSYVPAPGGHYRFFLSPQRPDDGARLVEFDRDGKQIQSYRFRGGGDPAHYIIASPGLTSVFDDPVSGETIALAGFEGKLALFKSPR